MTAAGPNPQVTLSPAFTIPSAAELHFWGRNQGFVAKKGISKGIAEVFSEISKPMETSRNVFRPIRLRYSRDNCRIFEPWTPSRDAFATAFFGQREPHLNELWAMSENAA